VVALLMTGGPTVMVKTTGSEPVPAPLVAVRVALKVPVTAGEPVMAPVAVFTVSPGGRPVAP
jgi:hypothetical protein